MTIRFFGGPFHGLSLGVIEIQRYLFIVSLQGRGGVRRFAALPSPEDWPEVLAGRMKVEGSASRHYYELISTPQGLQFRNDPQGRDFRRAAADDLAGTAPIRLDPDSTRVPGGHLAIAAISPLA